MPTIISPAILKEHFETDLSDAALQRVIDGVDADIIQFAGLLTNISEVHAQPERSLFLARPASTIVSVTETRGGVATVLAANDYILWDGYRVERLNTGTNAQDTWPYNTGDYVTVVYTPQDDTARRVMAAINMCKIDLQYMGVKSQSLGDYNYTAEDAAIAKRKILATLRRGLPFR